MTDTPSLKDLLEHAATGDRAAIDALNDYVEERRVGPLLDTPHAAAYCGLAPGTMYNLAYQGEGPVAHKHGRRTVYYPVDLDVFLAAKVFPAANWPAA